MGNITPSSFLKRGADELTHYFYLCRSLEVIHIEKASWFMADYQETNLWEWCKTHGDYEGYLMRYPNGIYAAEARSLMARGDVRKGITEKKPDAVKADPKFVLSFLFEQEKKELEAFNNCHTVADYEEYVKKYPFGKYTSKAKELILKLRTSSPSTSNGVLEQELDRIDAAFKKCKSIQDYEKFILTCPNEKYKEQARASIEKLKAEQEVQRRKRVDDEELAKCKTIEDYRRFIKSNVNCQRKVNSFATED